MWHSSLDEWGGCNVCGGGGSAGGDNAGGGVFSLCTVVREKADSFFIERR